MANTDPAVSYRVTYEYTDQFGKNHRESPSSDSSTLAGAQAWAQRHFTEVTPGAGMIPSGPTQRELRIVGCVLVVGLCALFLANLGLAMAH